MCALYRPQGPPRATQLLVYSVSMSHDYLMLTHDPIGAHAGVVVKLGDERQHQDRVDSRRDRERRALHVAEADALALVRARARVR